MSRILAWAVLVCSLTFVCGVADHDDDVYHREIKAKPRKMRNINMEEFHSDYWRKNAQRKVRHKIFRETNKNIAKNVIMFLGDGMSIQTLAPARTLMGQRKGKPGEEEQLSFEKFPTVGLVKTYCVDYQIPDSACTANAYLTGIKNNFGTIGVTASVDRRNCNTSQLAENRVESIAAWALHAGKDAGIVTSARVTHASPAGTYAKIANRLWEADAHVLNDNGDPTICPDIAHQLVHEFPGKDFKVILGGGRRGFIPAGKKDEEGTSGQRLDHRNLTEEWLKDKTARKVSNSYVWHRKDLLNVDLENTDYLLGLFEGSHLRFNLLTDPISEPTLEELTEVAIKMLRKSNKGYFLFVEGGRIDHAQHETLAQLSLDETIELAKAVQKAVDMTDEADTLIVVTSDHSHVLTYNGYSFRGNNILGPSNERGGDGIPYMTLSYSNGPGFRPYTSEGIRQDPTSENYMDPNWKFPAGVPLESETHGGEDTAVFAYGPHNHMFTGHYEQNEIPHLMAYASCIGPGYKACDFINNSATTYSISLLSLLCLTITKILF